MKLVLSFVLTCIVVFLLYCASQAEQLGKQNAILPALLSSALLFFLAMTLNAAEARD